MFVSLLLASCSSSEKEYKIGVSQCSEDIWRNWQNAEMRMEANFHDGVDLLFTVAYDNSERQILQIDSLVTAGIDLLIVAPNQLSSVSPAIDRAYDRGIPVIVFERKTDSPKYTAFVSADNYEMGHQMGEFIVSDLGGSGQVMEILGLRGSSPADERHKGFIDALSQAPGVEVVATLQGDWTEETAYRAVKDFAGDLSAVDFVFGHNDRTALGARKAFSEDSLFASRQLPMPLFCGIDGLPGADGGIQQVRDSLLDATYIYPTRGDLLLQLAIDILDGKPFEKETQLKSALVTSDNANVLLLESEEVMRQAQTLERLHQRASGYLQQLSAQRTITLLAIGIIILLSMLVVALWLYFRQRTRIQRERTQMEHEQLDFYTRAAHELRTPLTLIEGPLSQLDQTSVIRQADGEASRLFEIVRRNTANLSELVNRILDQSLIPSSQEIASSADTPTDVQPVDSLPIAATDGEKGGLLLIVDDNADIRTYLRTILQPHYQLLEAADGQEGLSIATEQVPDLVVSDVMMPVMNGLDFCQKLKENMVTSHIPVILLTARALSQHQIEGYQSGADAYITKPFQADLLLARIYNLLKSRKVLKNLWEKTVQQLTDRSTDALGKAVENPESPEGTSSNTFLARFKGVVEEKMADSDLSVEEIGSELGLSRVQLYRKVKALTGLSPVELLRKARLDSAQQLLVSSDLSISEVAYKVGFSSPSYFSKCFKDEFGVVPGDIRNVSGK